MGFDLYGMNPVIKEGSIKPEMPETYPGHPGNYDSDCWLSREEYEEDVRNWRHKRENDAEYQALLNKYYDDLHKYETENNGVYFRSNVWYWRPIVDWLVHHIEVLDEEDIKHLSYNDGHVINETVAKIIGNTIQHHNDEGLLDDWVQTHKIAQALKDKEDCSICEGTGVRTDAIAKEVGLPVFIKNGIEGHKCNGCDGEGKKEAFENNYPYDKEVLLRFGKFTLESGGFQIC